MTKRGYLKYDKVIDLLHRRDGRLVKMHVAGGKSEYFVLPLPGGRVALEDAEKIINRDDIVAGHDGLFPGMDQTWRHAGVANSDHSDAK
jgi:hypothetical protein